MNGTRMNEGSGSPTTRRPSWSSTFRLRTLLVVVMVISAGALYERVRCSGPIVARPVLGKFTIHCEWRDRTVRSLKIYDYLTDRRTRLDPISRTLINRMALTVAKNELGRLGSVDTAAQLDVQIFGSVLPCGAAVLSTEFTNPGVVNLKPRLLGNPPIHPGACGQ
jgi:hypothetical protein